MMDIVQVSTYFMFLCFYLVTITIYYTLILIFQIACEKFAAAEKSPKERNNQAAAEMIKVRLFLKLNNLVPNYLAKSRK